MGVAGKPAQGGAPLTFAGAAQIAAAAVEARWPHATAIVIWSASTGTIAMCRGAEIDLGSTDLDSDSDLLDSVAELLPPAAKPRARHGRPRGASRAVTIPLIVDAQRVGLFSVVGLPAPRSGSARELLESFALLLAAIRHREMHGERLAREAETFRLQAGTDLVTGLLNRRGFLDRLEAHCTHANDASHGDMLLLADVRGLMEADDRYGYAAGDHLLCQVAEVLDTTAAPEDVSGRVDHDLFAVILCGDDPAARAMTYAADVQCELDRRADERRTHLTLDFTAQRLAEVGSGERALQRMEAAPDYGRAP